MAMSVQQGTCTVCGLVKPGPAPSTRLGQPPPPFVCSDCLRDEPRIQTITRTLQDAGWEVGGPETSNEGAFWRAGGIPMQGAPTGVGPAGGGRTRLEAVEDLYRRI